jgi:hypothetical protein
MSSGKRCAALKGTKKTNENLVWPQTLARDEAPDLSISIE